VIFTLRRADALAAAGRVHASLSYSSFEAAHGGDDAARLHWCCCPLRAHHTAGRGVPGADAAGLSR